MPSIRQTRVAVAALACAAALVPSIAAALEPTEAVPKMTIKGKESWPTGEQQVLQLVSTYKHDVFADIECAGTDAAGKLAFGPARPGSAALVDAGKTVTKAVVLEYNDWQAFRDANPGKDVPVPAAVDCKIVKIEVMK